MKQRIKRMTAMFCMLFVIMMFLAEGKTLAEEISTEEVSTEEVSAEESSISADGNLSDWRAVSSLPSTDDGVAEWKIAKSADGSQLYFCFTGTASTQWDSNYLWKSFEASFGGSTFWGQINGLADAWIAPGAEVVTACNASGNNPGTYVVECVLPVTGTDYTVTFAGTTVSCEEIPVFVPAEEIEAVYEGIVIDGNYDDWDAVVKYEAACPEEANHSYDCLDYAACLFDGEYVYIYLQDGIDSSAAGAGTFGNGRYSIMTDTGRQLVFQLLAEDGGSISGVDGAVVEYFGNEWEIAIPASALPLYNESISFGLYQEVPFVADVVNLQGGSETGGTAGEFSGITYDGHFGDWDAYPHTLIHYATAGTQTNSPDGEGALYLDGSTLYGHVISSMDAHLAEMGGEFAKAISICFNGEREYNGDKTWNLYPKVVAVAADGTINWDPQTADLEDGVYEFYIADARGEYNPELQTNIADLAEHEQFFGKMMVEVNETNDEVEFYIDLEKVAAFLSYHSGTTIEASDFKVIEAQFGRIGNDFLVTAGASSGAAMGIVICILVVAGVLMARRGKVVG